jgi:hypothetical protein
MNGERNSHIGETSLVVNVEPVNSLTIPSRSMGEASTAWTAPTTFAVCRIEILEICIFISGGLLNALIPEYGQLSIERHTIFFSAINTKNFGLTTTGRCQRNLRPEQGVYAKSETLPGSVDD